MRSSGTASIHDSLRDSLFRRALLKFERDFYQRYLRSFRFSIRNSKYYGPSKQFSSTERPSDLSQNSCNQKRQFTIEMQNICKIPRGPSKQFSCNEKSSDLLRNSCNQKRQFAIESATEMSNICNSILSTLDECTIFFAFDFATSEVSTSQMDC